MPARRPAAIATHPGSILRTRAAARELQTMSFEGITRGDEDPNQVLAAGLYTARQSNTILSGFQRS
jgi:hypothetical protein